MLRPQSASDLNVYKYTLADIKVSVNGQQQVILAQNIKSLTIVNDYENNIAPTIQMIASVEKEIYRALTMEENKIKMTITLHKIATNTDARAREQVFSKTFSVRNEYDFQPDEVRTLWNEKMADEKTKEAGSPNQLIDASFYLIDEVNLLAYQKPLSIHFNGNITTALGIAFHLRGFSHVFINRIPSEYSGKIMAPTANLLSNIEFLNNTYGIYNSDYMFYMGVEDNYLLDKINLGKAIHSGAPSGCVLYLEQDGSPEQSDTGSLGSNGKYIANIMQPPKIMKLDNYTELLSGTTILAVDNMSNPVTHGGGKGAKVLQVMNQKIPKQMQHTSKDVGHSVHCNILDNDFMMITPNLEFQVVAHKMYDEVNNVSGKYRMVYSLLSFTKATEEEFTLSTDLILKKLVA